MSGSDRRRAPTTDAELAREFDRRIDALEHPSANRVGKWVLATGPGDDLIASYVGGGSVVLSPPPKVGDSPDDTQHAQVLPELVLTRTSVQSIAAGADRVVEWENIVTRTGEWDIPGDTITTIPFPVGGLWMVSFEPQWADKSSTWANHQINIDGDATALERKYPGGNIARTAVVTVPRIVTAGQVLTAAVRTDGSTHKLGTSAWNTNVVTRLSLVCLRMDTDTVVTEDDNG